MVSKCGESTLWDTKGLRFLQPCLLLWKSADIGLPRETHTQMIQRPGRQELWVERAELGQKRRRGGCEGQSAPILSYKERSTSFLPVTASAQCCQIASFFPKDQLPCFSMLNLIFLNVNCELKIFETHMGQTIHNSQQVSGLKSLWIFWSLGFLGESTLLEKQRLGCRSCMGHPKNGFWSDAKLTAGSFVNQWLHCWFGPNLFNPSTRLQEKGITFYQWAPCYIMASRSIWNRGDFFC